MFTQRSSAFLYAVTPVHVGGGEATGVIDNAIQREVGTGLPMIAGSGIKGAVRHAYEVLGGESAVEPALFGPATDDGEKFAGAVAFGDAQLVLFPIRSLKGGFVYATSGLALARLARVLTPSGIDFPAGPDPVAEGQALITGDGGELLSAGDCLHLELFEYTATGDERISALARRIAELALPASDGYGYFREKIERHLVVLNDGEFAEFTRQATSVEAHVRIGESGAADAGGLFYTENLPAESLLVAPLLCGAARRRDTHDLAADVVRERMDTLLDGKLLQVGGDATTGRGQVRLALHGGRDDV